MKHRILVVEDDPLFRELLAGWLETEGFEAVLADTLEAAFILIAAEPLPEAVLLDIHLGNTNGLTLVHWARKQRHLAHLQIVAVTGGCLLQRHQKRSGCGLRWLYRQACRLQGVA
jgi:DNA-binding response OmpR family regulator